MLITDRKTPVRPASVVEGTQFTKADLLSLVDDFAHDVRSPLTVISEFSSMLQEGVLATSEERDEATGAICEKTAETLLLVDALDMLVRAVCDSLEIHTEIGQAAQVLNAAVSQLEQFASFRRNTVTALSAGPSVRIRCDSSLAAMSLVHMWMWMRRSGGRNSEIDLETRPVPALNGVVFLAAKRGSSFDGNVFAQMTSPLADTGGRDGNRQDRTELRLRIACELGRLAGGDVFVLENKSALALYVPAVDDNRE